jgi:hypothetical protein
MTVRGRLRTPEKWLRGTVVDLVREVPARTPKAQDLELRESRPWRLECSTMSSSI